MARRTAGDRALVAGAMGPLGVRIEPFGPTAREEARAYFREQAQALLEGGVDLFVLETFSFTDELVEAIRGSKEAGDLPIVAQMTVGHDLHTGFGTDPEHFIPRLEAEGIDVLGLNCSVGPHAMLQGIERIRPLTSLPLSAQPNGGLPREVGRKAGSRESRVDEVPLAERSRLGEKLARGERFVTVEIVPPRGCDPTEMLAQVATLKEAGVDAVNVPDGP
ncbi:MAG: homocysteine S-methyltransferase family protein, partial [Longimicrobiales bacterium]|nr:homocysteine S-methyltransferase family protein [Longimicrobiales bacterium]